jgi:hypothetical protein
MSKSRKKQKVRERAQQAEQAGFVPGQAPEAGPGAAVPAPPRPRQPQAARPAAPKAAEPTLSLPKPSQQPLNQAVFDLAVQAATNQGVMREEGERLSYLYNGEALAVKYVEPGPGGQPGASVMVAAFKRGVVYQVNDGRQVVYQPGDWEQNLQALAAAELPDEDADVEPGMDDPAEEGEPAEG